MKFNAPRYHEPSRGTIEMAPPVSPNDSVRHALLRTCVEAGSTINHGHHQIFRPSRLSVADYWASVGERWSKSVTEDTQVNATAINVDIDDLATVKMATRRASAQPLAVNLDDKDAIQRFDSEPWRYLLSKIQAWGYLSLNLSVYSDKRPLCAALTRRAPKLESLKIHNIYSNVPAGMDADDSEMFVLPRHLFAGHTPSLRKVSILNVYFPLSFDFTIWQQLTVLCVYQDVEELPNYESYSAKWLEILRGMPLLETVNMGWRLNCAKTLPPFKSNSQYHSMSDVRLDLLHQLELDVRHGGSKIAWSILPKLVVPSDCNVRLLEPDVPLAPISQDLRSHASTCSWT